MTVRAHCMLTPFDATTGAALTSATVNVFQPGTVTPVAGTLFDKNGNTLSNPLTSDATTGLVDFYMNVPQEVDLQVAKAAYTTRTYSNVPLLDDASFDLSALLTTTGDLPYASSANTPARLPIGSAGAFLTVTGGVPAWSNTIASGGLTITAGGLTVSSGGATITGTSTFKNTLILDNFAVAAVAAGQIGLGATVANTATAGANTLPANPVGFWVIDVAGTIQKVPYYGN